jgi:TonB-linked SusC/RagA family outer membrane protein
VYDPFAAASIFDPTLPVYNEEGGYNLSSQWASNGYNPVAELADHKDDNSSKTTTGTGILVFKILDGLTFTSNNTYSSGSTFNQAWRGPLSSEALSGVTRAEINSNSWNSFQNSNFLTYDKTFGDHHVTTTLLYEQSRYKILSQRGLSKDLSTTALNYYNLRLGNTQETYSDYSSDAMQSYMARVNYSFKDRYLLTLSFRRDGSSKLTDKYDNFPSAAIAWNIAQEDFLKDHPVISGLKLRASYGETGNQAVGAYSTIAQVETGSAYFFDGTTPTTTTGLGTAVSKKLKWEHAKQTDIGLDVVLYNGKITFTADYYNKDVEDLLYDYSAPLYMGGGTYKRNMGKLNNKGLELSLGGIPVSGKDFSWNTFFTISFNKNKVKDLMGEDNLPASGIGTFGSDIARLIVGRSLGEFYGYQFLGTWKSNEATEAAQYGKKPGDAKYLDKNNDYAYTSADRTVVGNGTPDFTFGFTNDFKYRNFTLSFMFQGMVGNDIYSQTLGTMWGGHGIARNATIKDALNVWTPEKETDIPVLGGSSDNFFNSSRFVYDGSFIKLKNLSLNYNVPKRLIDKLSINDLEIYVSGQNLFTITSYPGYDPEVNSATDARTQGVEMGVIPNPRTYTMGLRVGF